jgi:flavin reductase (DIM6/NTAB) family NADH-FMN oxidoreductase RutF
MKKPIDSHQAYRLLSSGPTLLLTTQFHGQPNVMTVGWSTPLSAGEALIGIAVAPTRLSHEFIVKTDEFALNVPHIDLLSRVWYCGTTSGRDADKWETAPLTPAEPTMIASPLVNECLAWLECAVINRVSVGDHTLFIAEVLHAQVEDAAFDETWRPSEEAGRTLHHLGANLFTAPEPRLYRA